MNLQLTELAIRGVCRDLLRTRGAVSGRALRAELRTRYGAAGKTERVFRIWRSEMAAADAQARASRSTAAAADADDIRPRLADAEARAAKYLARAQLSEEREEAHQARWALEIDRLREQLKALPNLDREVRQLQARVIELTVELAAYRHGAAG